MKTKQLNGNRLDLFPGEKKEPAPFIIQDGVPIPQRTGRHHGPLRIAMMNMRVGQSFTVPKSCKDSRLWVLAKLIGIKIATRKEGNGRRIWRVK